MGSNKNHIDHGKVLLFALLITATFHKSDGSHDLSTGRDLMFNELGQFGEMFNERQFVFIEG